MVKIFQLALIILIFSTNSLFAQIEISGQVKDKNTKDNLSFCSVVILNNTDSIITGAVTDEKGYFYIPVSMGNYKIILSYVGYNTDTITIGFIQNDKFLGVFKLEPNSEMIDEITVKSNAKENTIDKDIQIITDDMRKGSTDTKEVLEKVSGVSYDRYNNSIKVDNNKNIIILVNGVEKNQEYIKNLSPERLQKIEIIRDPGGRYGLEGYSAVINVILRKDYVGSEIFISEQPIIDLDQKDKNYFIPINNFYGSYNFTYNKVNVYGNISNNFSHFALNSNTETEYDDGTTIQEIPPTIAPNTFIRSITTNYTLGADYYINPKHSISFETNLTTLPKETSNQELSVKTMTIKDGVTLDSYNFNNSTESKSSNEYYSLFYRGKFNENNTLDVDMTFSNYSNNYTNNSLQENIYERVENGTNNKYFNYLNVEFNHIISKKTGFQIGYGNMWKELNNNYLVSQTNLTTSENNFKLTDFRNKFYGYFSWKINKKLGAKFGSSGELSNPKTSDQENNYLISQPLIDIKYDLNKFLNFKLKYRSGSNYPSIEQTNPFTNQLDPNTISKGNPLLKPAVTHKISLKVNILQGLLSVKPYYHFSNNFITQTGTLRADSIFEFNYDNIGFYEQQGIQLNFTIPFGKVIFFQNSLDFYNSKIINNAHENKLHDWNINSQLMYVSKRKGTVMGINFQRAMSKNINALGYSRGENDYWLLLIQQAFLKKRLNIMFVYLLPINFATNYNQDSYIETNGYKKIANTDISVLKNMILFRVSYRFSKGKTVKKTEKHIDKEPEKNKKGGLI